MGSSYQFRTVSVWPRPVQQPHPRVCRSGSTPESGEFAARLRLGLGDEARETIAPDFQTGPRRAASGESQPGLADG